MALYFGHEPLEIEPIERRLDNTQNKQRDAAETQVVGSASVLDSRLYAAEPLRQLDPHGCHHPETGPKFHIPV